jgi:hypothetical protein
LYMSTILYYDGCAPPVCRVMVSERCSSFTKQRLADAFRDSVAGVSAIRCHCGVIHRIVASQRGLIEELGRIGQNVVLNPAKVVAVSGCREREWGERGMREGKILRRKDDPLFLRLCCWALGAGRWTLDAGRIFLEVLLCSRNSKVPVLKLIRGYLKRSQSFSDSAGDSRTPSSSCKAIKHGGKITSTRVSCQRKPAR